MIAEGLCPSMMDNIIARVDCKIVICHYVYSLNTMCILFTMNTKIVHQFHFDENSYAFMMSKITDPL